MHETPRLYELVFFFIWFGKKTLKTNINGGTFIIVVCFYEGSPSYIWDVELDNGSNVEKKQKGGLLWQYANVT